MISTGLSDIDALLLSVRDKESRRLIEEASSAYRGGAYRSAVVSTWIAVVYDIVAKARELAAKGEGEARVFVGEIDGAIAKSRATKDYRDTQTIERDLLLTAKDRLQIIAEHEFTDLDRLQKDRNSCAHPAFIADNELFQPTAELTRAHLVHALRHLLIHAPLQGKAALSRLEADVLSLSYPTTRPEIGAYISDKYLARAKDTLVKEIIKRLITALFSADRAKFDGHEWLLAFTLAEVSSAKPAIYDQNLPSLLNPGVDSVDDASLLGICRFIEVDSRIWSWLSENARLRVRNLLAKAPVDDLKKFDTLELRAISELSEILVARFNTFDVATQKNLLLAYPRPEFIEAAIAMYSNVRSYRSAEDIGQTIITRFAPFFSVQDVIQLLNVVEENDQIWCAGGTPKILQNVFDMTSAILPETKARWTSFLDLMLKNANGNPEAFFAYPDLRKRLAI